jgi:hypothetical protein
MKSIIKRNLNLDIKYNLIDKNYISLIDGNGCTCDNCGKLIANIATVKNENNEIFTIGFDCLETLLLNNNLLNGKSILEYQNFKSFLPSYIKKSKELKETVKNTNLQNLNKIVSIEVEAQNFINEVNYWNGKIDKNGKIISSKQYFTFNYIFENGKKYNSNFKMNNEIDVNDFIKIIQNITNLQIIKN